MTQRLLSSWLISRARSIVAIKHEAHVTHILNRNVLLIFMHFVDVQASV
jgi:hypothetical protein